MVGNWTVDQVIFALNELQSRIGDRSQDAKPPEICKIMMLINSLGSAFDVAKKILASIEDLMYDRALAQLKKEEQVMKCRSVSGASLATVYSIGISAGTCCSSVAQ